PCGPVTTSTPSPPACCVPSTCFFRASCRPSLPALFDSPPTDVSSRRSCSTVGLCHRSIRSLPMPRLPERPRSFALRSLPALVALLVAPATSGAQAPPLRTVLPQWIGLVAAPGREQ